MITGVTVICSVAFNPTILASSPLDPILLKVTPLISTASKATPAVPGSSLILRLIVALTLPLTSIPLPSAVNLAVPPLTSSIIISAFLSLPSPSFNLISAPLRIT